MCGLKFFPFVQDTDTDFLRLITINGTVEAPAADLLRLNTINMLFFLTPFYIEFHRAPKAFAIMVKNAKYDKIKLQAYKSSKSQFILEGEAGTCKTTHCLLFQKLNHNVR